MIRLNNVSKKFLTGVFALSDISFEIEKGEFVFLVGPTGSGKTTIFRLLTREILPTTGEIVVDNWDIVKLPKKKEAHLRKKIGVIFQDLKLLMDRTVFENIVMPLEVVGIKPIESRKMVLDLMGKLGIENHIDKFPIQLSGGELQRVAIARALILSPEILLADEPTGNLDSQTGFEIVKMLSEINAKGTTIIMATHNEEILRTLAKRTISLSKGQLIKDSGNKNPPAGAKPDKAGEKEKATIEVSEKSGMIDVDSKKSDTKKEKRDEDF